jgi:hypothetical protein
VTEPITPLPTIKTGPGAGRKLIVSLFFLLFASGALWGTYVLYRMVMGDLLPCFWNERDCPILQKKAAQGFCAPL